MTSPRKPANRSSAGKKPPAWLSPMPSTSGERALTVTRLWPAIGAPGQEAVHHGQDVGRIEAVRARLHPLEDVVQPHRGAAEVGPEERLGRVLVLERPGREVDVQDASGDDAWHSAASASQRWPVAKRPTPADPASVRRPRVARYAPGALSHAPRRDAAGGPRGRSMPAGGDRRHPGGSPGVPRQPIGQRGAQQPRELVPLDQEGVVALGRLDLDVGRVDARGRRLAHQAPDLVRPVEDVALDADAGQPARRRPRARGRPPRCRRGPGPRRGRP